MTLDDINIILCRPEESGNIGATCRAMKNMGLSRLCIVDPPSPLSNEIIQSRSIHAQDVWEKAKYFNTLSEAISDCPIVIGTTRRRGKKRKNLSLTPEEVAQYLKERPGQAAIVFGNERTGLETKEMELCTIASYIPANKDFPSLNLSHAVQIYGYVLYRNLQNTSPGNWVPLGQNAIELLVQTITTSLQSIGFYKQAGKEEQSRFFRDILSRAGVTLEESHYIEQICNKIQWLSTKNIS